tara:strand:- start:7 stop:1227 length:1221 start_codon:yes stop_codon:yes gene_type:complete
MANNALIQGAKLTGKKFLDVGGAVAAGLNATPGYVSPRNDRVAENKAIQAKVNSYMGKMKTDMDFTSFNPAETATMRDFLLSQRTIYTDAAKKAAEFDDTTDPDYMMYVDQMQNVNNSFTNLAEQLKSYKKSKLDYAGNMQEGLYSDGNPDPKSKEAAIIYGFYDADGDGRSEDKYDAPFQIQEGGNIAFNVGGQEISYNGMEEPFLKDTKFLNSLNKTSEDAYNSGLRGNANNPYAERAYDQQLNDTLQNENALRSIIFDFNAEAPMNDIGNRLDNGEIDLAQARGEVKERLLIAREKAYATGKSQYDKKQEEINATGGFNLSASQIASNNENTDILNAWASDATIVGPKKFNYIVRSPKARSTTTQRAYEISKTTDGKYFLISNGRPEPLSAELAKEMFNIDLK